MLGYLDPDQGSQILAFVTGGIGLAIYVVLAVLIARWAGRKGSSFGGFLALGLIISPIVSFIAALVIDDKRQPRQVFVAQPAVPGSHLDELQKLTNLRDSGTLSAEEFEAEKARILQARQS
ncbi:MAG: SHOCT domain-containing protein [Thermoleophilaceae bacterium]